MKQIANIEIIRLKALADLLDTVEDHEFTLEHWVQDHPRDRKTTLFGLIETDPGCGFAGCAMGWAAHQGIFPDFQVRRYGQHDVYYGNLRDWDAVNAVLGFPKKSHMSLYLFGRLSYKTYASPALVAYRVRRFVAKIEAIRARDRIR